MKRESTSHLQFHRYCDVKEAVMQAWVPGRPWPPAATSKCQSDSAGFSKYGNGREMMAQRHHDRCVGLHPAIFRLHPPTRRGLRAAPPAFQVIVAQPTPNQLHSLNQMHITHESHCHLPRKAAAHEPYCSSACVVSIIAVIMRVSRRGTGWQIR